MSLDIRHWPYITKGNQNIIFYNLNAEWTSRIMALTTGSAII